jgi:type II secretory pathway predicted ATPase ExeA
MSLEKHFGFINHPFPIEENAKFFYFSKKLRTDFERFLYTLRLESGIFYIIGAHATGRSYFLNALGKHISVNDLFIKLNPKQKGYSLISDICSILNLKEKTLETLNGYLKSVQKTGINVVIAIDSVKDINNEQLKILSELYRINNKIKILLLVEKYTKFYNRLKDNNINNLREKPVYI